MDLEGIVVQPTPWTEVTKHYTKYALSSISQRTIDTFMLTTARRKKKERGKKDTPFAEEVIERTTEVLTPVQIFYGIANPAFGAVLAATNLLSWGYERFIRTEKKSEKPKKTLTARIREAISYHGLKSIGRKLATHLCSYALLSTLAVTHYALRDRENTVDPEKVNFRASHCEFQREGQLPKIEFYLVGETHWYNDNSSFFMDKLLRKEGITVLLTEGVSNNKKKSKKSSTPLAEKIFQLGLYPVVEGIGWNAQSSYILANQMGIRVGVLEQRLDNNGAPGTTPAISMGLGIAGAWLLWYGPHNYLSALPFREAQYPRIEETIEPIISFLFPEVLDRRNTEMAARALPTIEKFPQEKFLVVFGALHIPGIKREFEKSGNLSCKPYDWNK